MVRDMNVSNGEEVCLVPACPQYVWARGYCTTHYGRAKAKGLLGPVKTPGPKPKPKGICVREGCEQPAEAAGLCNPHYQKWYRYQIHSQRKPKRKIRRAFSFSDAPISSE